MEAFIVRPFGEKNGINFDEVQEKLILPALEEVGIKGYTTGVILEAGNIRQDMFQLLLTSDIVIADISIHNANVFYELGVRHALRAGKTILIRCSKDQVPFDLKTDRYLAYDENDPASNIPMLSDCLKQTMNSDRADSPVFLMLPNLESQNPERFLAIPSDFSKEVFIAQQMGHCGKLALLASEAQFFSWQLPALRMIGNIQFRSNFYSDAKETWERIQKRKPKDIEANERLATIYHRLEGKEAKKNPDLAKKLLAKSELAINRLFDQFVELPKDKRAEAYALRARNEKAKWIRRWTDVEPEKMEKEAIRSTSLQRAYKNYLLGYSEDLNHFYSGVNALGLLKTLIELANRQSMVWDAKFDTVQEASNALSSYVSEFEELAITVRRAVMAKKRALERDNLIDPWVNITYADLMLLTKDNPERVANLYCMALESGTNLNFDAARRQLVIYEKLNVMPDNVNAALKEFSAKLDEQDKEDEKVLLFTGHMIDAEDRKVPRFPKEREAEVYQKIKAAVEGILKTVASPKSCVGIAGGACGGDLLFYEVCKEFEIPTKMDLALPPDQYIVESVQFAGSSWVDRFYAVYEAEDTEVNILAETKELPVWLQGQKGYSFWERNNLWLLNTALSYGDRNLTLVAVWDGKGEDGPGGTRHMIEEVKKRGAKSIVIDL
ncbi:MAG: hypothetical protein HKN31_04950 [Pricia sp.]|nr:hypothetical protein [Pricia sp.]